MKNKFENIAKNELSDVKGFNYFMMNGINEIISYLYDEDEPMDLFDFEQNILYYFTCESEHERQKVEDAAKLMFVHYKL